MLAEEATKKKFSVNLIDLKLYDPDEQLADEVSVCNRHSDWSAC